MSLVDYSEVTCPICLNIFVEPIKFPCGHRLCNLCFTQNLELTALSCPMCKKRLGSWVRSNAIKRKSMIDKQFWEYIQKEYGTKLKSQISIKEELELEEASFNTQTHHQFAAQGQIREEFETEILKNKLEFEKEREEENKKSEKLIESILKEENSVFLKNAQKQEEKSLQLIKKLEKEDAKSLRSKADKPKLTLLQKWTNSLNIKTNPSFPPVPGFTDSEIQEQYKLERDLEQVKQDRELALTLQKSSPSESPKQKKLKQNTLYSFCKSFSNKNL